jgi:hypothetical protein
VGGNEYYERNVTGETPGKVKKEDALLRKPVSRTKKRFQMKPCLK